MPDEQPYLVRWTTDIENELGNESMADTNSLSVVQSTTLCSSMGACDTNGFQGRPTIFFEINYYTGCKSEG